MPCADRVLVVIAVVLSGCGERGGSLVDGGPPPEDGGVVDAAASDGDVPVDAGVDAEVTDYPYSDLDEGCAPIFRQSIVPEYHVTMSPEDWAAMEHEFLNPRFTPGGSLIEPGYHPAQLHIVEGEEEHDPPDVMIRLNGNTSWLQTIRYDEHPKMQFMIAFNEVDSDGRFQDLRKIKLDMPRSDWTFIQQRVALAWLRGRAGVPAQCANSARVYMNGAYYGLYTNAERQDKGFLKRIYGGADNDGDLWAGARSIKTNEETFSWGRISAFWDIESLAELDALVDLDTSMVEWASEAVIGDADGYNQGRPNFLLYDRPSNLKFVWLANDLDTSLDDDFLPPDTTPLFAPERGRHERDWHHYLIALNQPAGVARYVQAMATLVPRLDPEELEAWIDDWSEQIAAAAAEDPRRPFSMEDHEGQLARMKQYAPARRAYLEEWLGCWSDGGDDGDGDGFDMCHDCDDDDAAQSPGAVEVCDNIDNDCDGRVDDGVTVSCAQDPEAAAREAFWNRVYTDVKAQAKARR